MRSFSPPVWSAFEETLTDPSYYGQIITQTYPLIGNYGMNSEDVESGKIWAKGYIVREACKNPSNFRSEETLDSFLKKHGIIGIEGIDTRSLTRTLRESGVMNGAITTEFDPRRRTREEGCPAAADCCLRRDRCRQDRHLPRGQNL